MTEACHPTCEQYEDALHHGRGVPVYSGSILQRGHGVGGVFRRLASGLLPLLPAIGKAALGVASDKMKGIPLSRALKTRGLAAGRDLLKTTRKPARKPVKRRAQPTARRIRKTDVFGSV